MASQRACSRRQFLAAAVGPLVLPAGVLARPGRPGANDRIVTGHIGAGRRGQQLLRRLEENAAAVCDVDRRHLHAGAAIAGPGVRVYDDYRALLDRADLDAVVIATPDHWHALQAVQAAEAGKDVYLEIPVCHTLAEAQELTRTAGHFGTVLQTGHAGLYGGAVQRVKAAVKGEEIGPIQRIRCWGQPNPSGGDPEAQQPPPGHLDWEAWLGPERTLPYNPTAVHENFRWMLAWGGGRIRRQGAHVFAAILEAFGNPPIGRVTVQAEGVAPEAGLWDCPTELIVDYAFSGDLPPVQWRQPPAEARDTPYGAALQGDAAVATLLRNQDVAWTTGLPEAEGEGEGVPPGVDPLARWFDHIRMRTQPVPDPASACRAAVLATLGNLAFQLGRSLTWDFDAQTFVDDAQANRLRSNPGALRWVPQ